MEDFDLVIVGTGSGNTVLDDRFAGWSVAVVERRTFGGTCVNRGCIPSKIVVHTAYVARDVARSARFDVDAELRGVDWPAVRERVFGRIDAQARDGERFRREQDGVTVLLGEARFTGARTLEVTAADGSTRTVRGRQVVLAVGSRPVVPPIEGLDDLRGPEPQPAGRPDDPGPAEWFTSDDVMRMERLPRRLAVLGGGYVGTELAHAFDALGSSLVQIDQAATLLSDHDEDVASSATAFARQRWDVRTGTEVVRVERTASGLRLHLAPAEGGGDGSQVEVDALLLAVGRRPSSDRVDVDAAGVAVDDDGIVVVDEHQRTTAEGVWALGDVSSDAPLKHVANQDARVVQHNLLHPDDLVRSDHDHVPSAVFAEPQVAAVGVTEQQARDAGTDIAVGTADLADTAFGWALEDDRRRDADPAARHFAKLLADRGTGLLVGAHVVAPDAAALLQPLVTAMAHGLPVRGLARSQYWIHPAPTELVEQALLDLEDQLDR